MPGSAQSRVSTLVNEHQQDGVGELCDRGWLLFCGFFTWCALSEKEMLKDLVTERDQFLHHYSCDTKAGQGRCLSAEPQTLEDYIGHVEFRDYRALKY